MPARSRRGLGHVDDATEPDTVEPSQQSIVEQDADSAASLSMASTTRCSTGARTGTRRGGQATASSEGSTGPSA